MEQDDPLDLRATMHVSKHRGKKKNALKILHTWTNENEMIVSIEKTKFQLFAMRYDVRKPTLTFDNTTLEETTSRRYLNFVLDQRLTYFDYMWRQYVRKSTDA